MQPLYGEPWIKRGFNSLSVVYTINITTDSIEVGPYLRVDIEEDRGHHAETSPIFVPQGQIAQPRLDSIGLPSKFKRDQVVPFGSIQEWKNDSDIVRLMLIKGSKKDEAKLCTNAELSFVRRLQCTVWHIPADWKWGQELQTPKGYIVDGGPLGTFSPTFSSKSVEKEENFKLTECISKTQILFTPTADFRRLKNIEFFRMAKQETAKASLKFQS